MRGRQIRQRNSESEIGHIKRQTERLRGRYIHLRETMRDSDSQTERQADKERKTDRHRNSESEIGHTERQTVIVRVRQKEMVRVK
jgi:hypothetical protein